MKLNTLLIILFLIFTYHNLIQNRIEKIFCKRFINFDLIKRPLNKCFYKNTMNCMGMPSGHSETVTILGFLLYFYKIIPLWICLFIIFIFSFQRVTSNRHTIIQVLIGIILGYFYALLYKIMNLSIYSFFIVLYIGITLYIFTLLTY
jgi:hypothetical protein